MSGASRVDDKPDFLQTAVEYRDHLKAELAKVDAFLSQADKPSRSRKPAYPDFLMAGNGEVLEALRSYGQDSKAIH